MAYWDKQDPSIDGVLGGHGDVSEVQLSGKPDSY